MQPPSRERGARPPLTEAQAIQLHQAGDRWAFRHLVHRHQDAFYGTVTLMTGSQKQAEQQVRNAFHVAWRGIHTFNFVCPVQSWFIRILVRQGASDRRASSSPTTPSSSRDKPSKNSRPSPVDQPDLEFQAMRLAFAGLEPGQRNVLVLRYFADLKEPDLALALDAPSETVEPLRRQALARLRELLEATIASDPKPMTPDVASDRALIQALRRFFTIKAFAVRAPADLWDTLSGPTGGPSRPVVHDALAAIAEDPDHKADRTP